MEQAMASDGRLPVACRYIPYDQWITTHVEPSWKIRVVKQWILSKCTGAPFDAPPIQAPLHAHVTPLRYPRKKAKKAPTEGGDSTGGGERPVSPITFAPDPRQRPISPILFARAGTVGRERRRPREAAADGAGTRAGAAMPTMTGGVVSTGAVEDASEEKDDDKEGYEEDDEWDTAEEDDEDEDDDDDDDLDLPLSTPSMSPLPIGGAILPASRKLQSTFSSPRNGKSAVTPAGNYTLIRFSTGQILEDEYLVSWYDLAPHELLELHSHVSQPADPLRTGVHNHARNASIFSTTTSGNPDLLRSPETRYLPRLNRTSLSTYILPYFQGWVFALRVVWREDALTQAFYGSGGGFAGSGFGAGHVHQTESAYGLPVGEDNRRGGRRRAHREGERDQTGAGHGTHGSSTRTTSLEWRPRWLVVTEGWVKLYRTREDDEPTHELPLSALMTLRGKEHLRQGTHLSQKPTPGNRRSKPHREHGLGSMHRRDMHSIHTASIHNTISSRNPRSVSPNRSQSRSRSRGDHPPNYGSDSHSDTRTPEGVVRRVGDRHRRVTSGGMERIDGEELTRGEGEEERRIVCMKFKSRSKWVVPPPEPAATGAAEKKRYTSTRAGYGGGGLDGHGMGVTSFVTLGHGGTAKDGKLKGKGKGKEKEKEKEKEEKKAKGRGKFRTGKKLDKRSLDRTLAMSVGGEGYGPYIQDANVSGAGASSKTFVGWEQKEKEKEKGRTRTFGGKSKDKGKENDGIMGLGMMGLGINWKGDRKARKLEQTGSQSTFRSLDPSTASSTAVSTGTARMSTSRTIIQTAGPGSSSSHMKPGAVSSGDDDDADGEGMHEEGEVDEEDIGGSWAVVENDGDSSSGSEVRFARLIPGAGVDSDNEVDSVIATNGPHTLATVVSDEDDASGSAPSDTEATPHRPMHPQIDLDVTDSEGSAALSDPVFAHSEDYSDDDGLGYQEGVTADDKKAYRYGYRDDARYETVSVADKEIGPGETEGATAQADEDEEKAENTPLKRKTRQREREQKEEKEKGEWVILDLGADLDYSSFLRILHRHFPPPVSSSFISAFPAFSNPTPPSTPTPTPTPTPFPSPTSPHSPVSPPFVWPSSPESLLGKIGARDPEPPSPLSTSSRGSQFRFEPPQHPAALGTLAVHTALPAHKTFGALPYPEWRMEVAERAQKAGMGDVGRAMRWVIWGCADQLAEDLAEIQSRNQASDDTNDGPPKSKGRRKSFALRNRRQSTTSTVGAKPGPIYDSDASEEMGEMMMSMSDSDGEGSEAEWHGWMADLPRQHQAAARREREVAEAALRHHSEDEEEEAPPKNQAEDQRRYLEQRLALEPHGVVTTAALATPPVHSTPSNTLYSPSSSESLAHHQRARALSFSPVDVASSAATSNPPSNLSHQHTPSSSPPDASHDRKHRLPPGTSLSHSTSMYANGLRDAFPETSLRRPSMPILTAEQTFSLGGGGALAPQMSILRSPTASSFTFPATGSSVSRSPPFSPAFSSTFSPHETVVSPVSTGPATMPRRASSAGLMNIGGVGGSLSRSSSVLTRQVLKKDAFKEVEKMREKEREKEKKAKDKEDKKAREKDKEKEKERSKDRGKDKRPKLSLATPSSSTTNTPTQSEQAHLAKSPKMGSIMRRVQSGSNLRMEDELPPSLTRDAQGASASKKKGVLVHSVERIVRGLDSALDFVDGR